MLYHKSISDVLKNVFQMPILYLGPIPVYVFLYENLKSSNFHGKRFILSGALIGTTVIENELVYMGLF